MDNKTESSWQDTMSDWLYSIIIAIVLAFCIRTFIVEPYMVSGPSMLPTLVDKERLLVNKFIYFVADPQRDEIIVFKYPMDQSRDFIKRVIAVGGDTIEIRSGQVYVNGVLKKEDYIKEPFNTTYRKAVVPKGHVFVLGDNRNNSEDSRFNDVGFVPIKLVKGKASVIFWPFEQLRTLP